MFVALDAGIGRLVAVLHGAGPETATGCTLLTPEEGPEFTEAHPRLHYGWRTTKEYRSRFGHLGYMCRRGPDEPYARDAGPPVRLPVLEERCGFVLYPYVSWTFAEAVTWSVHAEPIEQLRDGATHPAREEVLELARLAAALQTVWSVLGDPEREWVLSRQIEDQWPMQGGPSVELRRYLELEDVVKAISGSLRAKEADKIRRALAELDDWLLHAE